MKLRTMKFAGSWYPKDQEGCRQEIQTYVKSSINVSSKDIKRIGGIVPHAGWYFSGQIACNVMYCLKERQAPDVIVIFGMHLAPESPNFIMSEGAWETPLGNIEVERELAQQLIKQFSFQVEIPDRARQDNTIELQLPFVKYFFPTSKILTIGVPPTPASLDIGKAVVQIAQELNMNIKVIGSTDLTHYGYNYGFTSHGIGKEAINWVKFENDRRIIELMLDMEPENVIKEALQNANSCCSGAAATAIAAGKQLGATKAESLVYSTSYDKSPGDSFVGYVGIVF